MFTITGKDLIRMSFGQATTDDEDVMIDRVRFELDAYFSGQRTMFTLPIRFESGTDFERKVWRALIEIPYGETRSYQDIARAIGHDNAYRAVGQACKKNPIGIVVPCHRVIGKNKTMTGYSGTHVDLKKALLELERIHI
jgi:O-6-methylguanine DNA methyltransferase